MFPEMMCRGGHDPAAPAAEVASLVGPSLARTRSGNDVFIAYDRRATGPPDAASPGAAVGGGRPIWVPEAASILTSTAPIHGKVERWLVDTGCGYDLVARSHIESMKKWVRKAVKSKSFQTASGKTTADQVARMTVSEFGEEIAPYMLDSTPAGTHSYGQRARTHSSYYPTVMLVLLYQKGTCLFYIRAILTASRRSQGKESASRASPQFQCPRFPAFRSPVNRMNGTQGV